MINKLKLYLVLILILGVSAAFDLFPVDSINLNHKRHNLQLEKSDEAKRGFEKLKKLSGTWIGKSTKGWEEEVDYSTIANQSVVVDKSFGAHPNETMYTMFYLDGNNLMLTHYCVARNQPTLQATSFENNGKKITFTFVDASNLPSRNKGHMDKLVMEFLDDNNVTAQWTWYQDGKESWMEKINLKRKLK